jgi:hypothetical protein
MPPTLALAREAFIRQMNRDTAQIERPRMVAVLDAMIAWSVARPALVRFRADDNTKGIVRFESVSSHAVIWSATPRPHDAPVLELLPGASRVLTSEERASAIATLGAHTRQTLDPAGRLHIGFSALKNEAAKAAVLELAGDLLDKAGRTNRTAAPTP